jgi:hypothetical protein
MAVEAKALCGELLTPKILHSRFPYAICNQTIFSSWWFSREKEDGGRIHRTRSETKGSGLSAGADNTRNRA